MYFFVEVEFPDFRDQIVRNFDGEEVATPLQFYDTKEDVDGWIHFDPVAPFRNPEALRGMNDMFYEEAGGWEMSVEDAQDYGIPITHGCRFASNLPCVSTFFFLS